MENTLDLSKIFKAFKKQWKLLIILPIIFAIVSLLLTFFVMKPKYEADTQVLINQKQGDKNYLAQEVQSNIQLVNTYKEIVTSPRILEAVAKKEKKYSADELNKMIEVNNAADSQILRISVRSGSKKDSEKVANLVAKTVDKQMPKIMNVDNVSILSTADGTSEKVSPKPVSNIAIAIILGLLVAAAFILIRQLTDQRIRTEEDVESELGLPVLGTIQKVK